jgi:predicted transcriptional regulator
MTSEQTKKELSEEYKNVKYILTSGMRTSLLLAIYKTPKRLDDLRNELKKPSATILHGLKELENVNLVRKNRKNYELTSHGYLLTTNMIKLLDNWHAINKSKIFWNNHDLSGIPDSILKNIYLLGNAEYVNSTTSDLSSAFNTYIKLISNARKLKIIMPIYSENHFKHLIKLLNGEKLEKLELIISHEILKTIELNEFFSKELLKNKKVKVKCVEQHLNLFLTYSERFMSLTLFFKDGHYDDSQILIGKDKNARKWASNLFRSY